MRKYVVEELLHPSDVLLERFGRICIPTFIEFRKAILDDKIGIIILYP